MTPREWAAERQAALLRWDDQTTRAYQVAVLNARAVSGKLPPLQTLLVVRPKEGKALTMQLEQLSERLGVPFRKASPEALAALERLKARGQ